MRYALVNGDVVIADDDGALRWRGKPLGCSVKAVSPIDDTDAVVLLDYMCRRTKFENLIRLHADGTVAWQASLPSGTINDSFVSFRWVDERLIANTWSGYRVQIDVNDGHIASSDFVK